MLFVNSVVPTCAHSDWQEMPWKKSSLIGITPQVSSEHQVSKNAAFLPAADI